MAEQIRAVVSVWTKATVLVSGGLAESEVEWMVADAFDTSLLLDGTEVRVTALQADRIDEDGDELATGNSTSASTDGPSRSTMASATRATTRSIKRRSTPSARRSRPCRARCRATSVGSGVRARA